MTPPNLYSFATKELAQDATIAYILAWADPDYRDHYPRLHELGDALLRALLATKLNDSEIPSVRSVDIETQVDRIDVLVRINDDNPDGLVLLIEDKVNTHEHSNQVDNYIKKVEGRYDRPVVAVYLKTGNACMANLPDQQQCGRFLRQDLLGVLNDFADISDTVIDNFRSHLQQWEDETNSFSSVPLGEWDEGLKWHSIQGLYRALESRIDRIDDVWWDYTPNAAGGFQFFAFISDSIKEEGIEINVYLQIEDATRLTLRLGIWDGSNKVRSELMYKVLEIAQETAAGKYPFKIQKAGRFRGGKSAAVAEITFGSIDGDGYLELDKDGIIDMDQTIRRLDMAKEFVGNICNRWQAT